MNNVHVTADDVFGWKIWNRAMERVYTLSEIEDLFDVNETLNIIGLLRFDIPMYEKMQMVLRSDFFDDEELVLLTFMFSEEVMDVYELGYPGDSGPRAALTFLKGNISSASIAAIEARYATVGESRYNARKNYDGSIEKKESLLALETLRAAIKFLLKWRSGLLPNVPAYAMCCVQNYENLQGKVDLPDITKTYAEEQIE